MIDYNNHKTTNQERKQAMNNVAQKTKSQSSEQSKLTKKRSGTT